MSFVLDYFSKLLSKKHGLFNSTTQLWKALLFGIKNNKQIANTHLVTFIQNIEI